jgi:hypothetical protein
LFLERRGSSDFEIAIEQVAQLGTSLAVELFRLEEKEEFASVEGLFSLLLKLAVFRRPPQALP